MHHFVMGTREVTLILFTSSTWFGHSQMEKLLTLVLIRNQGRVLLGMKKRGFGQGRWNGFGGKVEPGETIEAAARRELKEESCLECSNLQLVGRIKFEFLHDPVLLHVHVFTSQDFVGQPQETEEMRPRWFRETEIPFDQMWPDDQIWFPLFLDNQKFEGYFLFEGHDKILKQCLKKVENISCG